MDQTAVVRLVIGLVMVAFGVHQIARPKEWFSYVPEFASKLVPEHIEKLFMQTHGGINVGLGLLFISGFSVVFVSWATLAWWVSILPFAFMHRWTIGLRDLAIVASVFAVAVTVMRQ